LWVPANETLAEGARLAEIRGPLFRSSDRRQSLAKQSLHVDKVGLEPNFGRMFRRKLLPGSLETRHGSFRILQIALHVHASARPALSLPESSQLAFLITCFGIIATQTVDDVHGAANRIYEVVSPIQSDVNRTYAQIRQCHVGEDGRIVPSVERGPLIEFDRI